MSTLVKTDTVGGDPIFAPVRKLAPELLAEIFILCISTLPEPLEKPGEPLASEFEYGMDLQAARGKLARVCRWWNAVLNDDPRVWATLALDADQSITPEIVTLWIKRSRSHPLDVYIELGNTCDMEDTILAVLHTHLWRIRCLVWKNCCWRGHSHLSTLLPPSVSTYAPMMQNLCLLAYRSNWASNMGDIHCPDLRTLTIKGCDEAVESLIGKPMPNVRHLHLFSGGPVMLYIKLLNVLPNLVSLKWIQRYEETVGAPNSRVVLQSLKSLTLVDIIPHFLACFYAPSLESLNLAGDAAESIHVLKIICQDWKVALRHLTITGELPQKTAIHAMLPHLTHLETLIVHPNECNFVDELLMALSPHNRDFTLACPQLKTMELNHGQVSTSALVDFVWRRVKRDLDDAVPGLMTSLKLSFIPVDQDVCEQLVKTHGSSVHIRVNLQTFIRLCF